MGRYKEHDSLRGLAALSVLLFHYTYFYNQIYESPEKSYLLSFKYGNFGVQLFFIISGFVIYMTVLKSSHVKEFAVKRAVRLYPAYLVSAFLTFTCITLFGLTGMGISMKDFLLNLTMVQGVIPGTGIDLVDGSYWSLAIEITFYVFCAILLSAGMIRHHVLVTSIWLASIFLIKVLYLYKIMNPVIGDLGIVNYSNLFIAGIMFYQLTKNKEWINHLMILLSLIYQFSFHGLLSGFIVSCFYLIFYLLIYNKLSFLGVRPLTFLGTISYSLYLVHQTIGYIIINFLDGLSLSNEVFLFIPISISVCLATVITFYIEKPVQKFILTKYKSKDRQKMPASVA